ncbi:3-oxoacid CoA-transferase subunit A [Halanaerobiaceae bacterium Z-7014]|uniref:3-oxoacid CoA-transferase subunit A n=1 Tax=Halonatronomonas betaini TaxID=2778430 RepID=A0A931ATZ5_9FIRM|nr:3-oxoacid CoA-transferase subunit A [Halonatronomonas betaini]MBF8438154.1 3-oxoacid CoA-transferase subunit A [Halonatronomonas betaini]
MAKLVNKDKIKSLFADEQSLMVGGFIESGVPAELIKILLDSGARDLTLIANDTGFDDKTFGQLVVEKRLKKAIVSHIGTNRETGKQMNAGELEVELTPQGTLIEQIRAGGAGLGGILTQTGIGTTVAEDQRIIEVDGEDYILARPLQADIALVKAWKADKKGNLIYRYAARNFNPIVATAADIVIVEADEILEVGEIDSNQVMTPGLFVDYILEK